MTGWLTPAAGAHTGPATRNAPGGSGATMVDLPVAVSRTPTPWSAAYAIRPCASPPATGDGECTGVPVPAPVQAVKIRTAAIAAAGFGMRRGCFLRLLPQFGGRP